MVDVLSKKQRSYNMSKIKCKNTKPEILLRKELWSKGFGGYRIHPKKITGKPDLIFRKWQIVLFVDGCQWHKCPRHYVKPKTNTSFWVKKIDGNVLRDKMTKLKLKMEGWRVIRIWEHDLKKKNINRTIVRLTHILKKKVKDEAVKNS